MQAISGHFRIRLIAQITALATVAGGLVNSFAAEPSKVTPDEALKQLVEGNARFVSGELSMSDYIAAVRDHADTLPSGAPVQEYFTSFDEAVKARDDSKGAS